MIGLANWREYFTVRGFNTLLRPFYFRSPKVRGQTLGWLCFLAAALRLLYKLLPDIHTILDEAPTSRLIYEEWPLIHCSAVTFSLCFNVTYLFYSCLSVIWSTLGSCWLYNQRLIDCLGVASQTNRKHASFLRILRYLIAEKPSVVST